MAYICVEGKKIGENMENLEVPQEDEERIKFKKSHPERFVKQIVFLRKGNFDDQETPMSTFKDHVRAGLMVKEDGLFDLEDPKNKLYVANAIEANRRRKLGLNGKGMHKKKTESLSVEVEMKQVALAKAKEDYEIQRLKRMKAEGELIPFEAAELAFHVNTGEIWQACKNAAEQLANITVKKLGGTEAEHAEMRGKLVEIFNQAIEESKETYKDQIKRIQDEFKSTK